MYNKYILSIKNQLLSCDNFSNLSLHYSMIKENLFYFFLPFSQFCANPSHFFRFFRQCKIHRKKRKKKKKKVQAIKAKEKKYVLCIYI